MVDKKPQHRRVTKPLWALAIAAVLSVGAFGKSAIAESIDFDSSHCKSAFAAGNYSSAAKYCRTEAEATVNMVKKSHLTGDSKADELGIAAIQMRLASVAQARDGTASDAAQASRSLDEARRLIHEALQSCTSGKCRNAMQREADRIESLQGSSS